MIWTYSPKGVWMLIGATPVLTFDKITVEATEDKHKIIVGTHGETTRLSKRTTLGTFKVVIPQTSNVNLFLSITYLSGGVIPVGIFDSNGLSLHSMLFAVIPSMPKVDYDKQSGSREWTMKGKMLTNFVTGTDILASVVNLFKG
jgi:hypothetical protein